MVGAGRNDVTGLQRMDRTHPLDDARDVMRHVGGVELLHHGAVVGQRAGVGVGQRTVGKFVGSTVLQCTIVV
mgnify:CR=1 FL=1